METAILSIVMRYVHIGAAVVAVGGSAFMLACMLPSLRLLEDNLRQSILKLASDRFSKWLYVSIAALIISGIYNWVQLNSIYNALGPLGQPIIGTKVLLALLMFALIGAQGAGIIKPRNPKRMLMINLHLAAIVILLGSILRYFSMTHLAG